MINKVQQFNLRRGMTTEQIYNELHGRTAGENQRERQLLFSAWEDTSVILLDHKQVGLVNHLRIGPKSKQFIQGRFLPKATVVMEYPGNYALILDYEIATEDIYSGPGAADTLSGAPLRRLAQPDPNRTLLVAKGELIKRFYLAGINDEGMYFVRPLQGVPLDKIRNIDLLLAWLNKTDLGYERIQGDILIKFIKKSGKTVQYKNRWLGFLKLSHISYKLPRNNSNKGYTDFYRLDSIKLTSMQNFGDHRVQLVGKGHIAFPHHSGVYSLEPVVIDGRQFTLDHPEHASKICTIPSGHYCVLASQRGRDEIVGHGIFD